MKTWSDGETRALIDLWGEDQAIQVSLENEKTPNDLGYIHSALLRRRLMQAKIAHKNAIPRLFIV